ncbi:hypothetical protein HHL22_20610 [Hymenobacter sp. RP-2-7]|uniref:Uncharacterized protein n=1 Tax=Hymenobacter polaris TaxID=2682546 RepID=A0A7Y0AIA9_9BACT|nr:hypothetical protein [Hymenobacter polaris]NML67610.1 hypothetical protein [Hymenobacter polaris]
MALTDDTFTVEEFQAAVAKNPALKDVAIASVKHLGLTPYTQQEYDAALSTKIDEKTNEIYSGLDKDLFETSGMAKASGTEKTYNYLKRVVGELKSAPTALQTKITELEDAIKNGGGDATLRAQLQQLKDKETQYQADLKDRDTKLFQKDVALDIRDGLRELKFDPTVKESLRKLAISNATANIMALATVEKDAAGNENIRYVRDGKVLLDKDGKPATAKYLLETEELTDVLDAGQQGQGGGAGAGGQGGKGGKVSVPEVLPGDVKTQSQLIDYLLKLGLAQETDEFDTAFDKLGKGLPIR